MKLQLVTEEHRDAEAPALCTSELFSSLSEPKRPKEKQGATATKKAVEFSISTGFQQQLLIKVKAGSFSTPGQKETCEEEVLGQGRI